MNQANLKFPHRLEVTELVNSRYTNGSRPSSWDMRIGGIDLIRASDGNTYKLQSDGGQSPPQKDWVIILSGGDAQQGYHWTLYGLLQSSQTALH